MISLDDKYDLKANSAMLSGTQALVRLALQQQRVDAEAGLNTGAYISGYRGSPLGGLDAAFWAAGSRIEEANIHFQPGVNEDLAATAVWGSQQFDLLDQPLVDGVYGMWYGKGPGVDR
ncbi:MAG: hypothetical protein AAGI11_06810, partial [Pseudomonadota bacterium]